MRMRVSQSAALAPVGVGADVGERDRPAEHAEAGRAPGRRLAALPQPQAQAGQAEHAEEHEHERVARA